MKKPENITGDWIKEKCNFLYDQYKDTATTFGNTFVLNKRLSEIRGEIAHYQDICPHSYNDMGICIYCKKKISEVVKNEQPKENTEEA